MIHVPKTENTGKVKEYFLAFTFFSFSLCVCVHAHVERVCVLSQKQKNILSVRRVFGPKCQMDGPQQ